MIKYNLYARQKSSLCLGYFSLSLTHTEVGVKIRQAPTTLMACRRGHPHHAAHPFT